MPGHALDFDAAIARMALVAAPLGQERVALADAAGRILARPVLARLDSPRAALAAMDGYAVSGTQASRLKVIGDSFPARPFRGSIGAGEAVRIFTGAPVPEGADRVIVQELAVRHGDEVAIPAADGRRHVRQRASDFAAGEALLSAGRRLDARGMLVAAAADAATLTVWRQPRVFILATGDELSRPGLASGGALSIPDSTSLAIAALATEWGATISGSALVPDDMDTIEAQALAAMAEADVLIVTGGASVGDRDFSRGALGALGLDRVFAGVAIKPGKPVWHGRVGGTQVLGLPGNPTAALVTARLFLAPLVLPAHRQTGRGGTRLAAGGAWRTAGRHGQSRELPVRRLGRKRRQGARPAGRFGTGQSRFGQCADPARARRPGRAGRRHRDDPGFLMPVPGATFIYPAGLVSVAPFPPRAA